MSSNSSEYSSDPSDDETSTTTTNTSQVLKNKQNSPQRNDKRKSSEDESTPISASSTTQKSAPHSEYVKKVETPQNNKEMKSEKSSEVESSKEKTTKAESSDSSLPEETSESTVASSSVSKSGQNSKNTKKKAVTKSSKNETRKEAVPAKSTANDNPKTTQQKTRDVNVDDNDSTNNNADNDNASNNADNSGMRTQDNERKMDRYGWYVDKKKLSKQELQLIQIESQKESERTQKWLTMTKNWTAFMKKNRNKVASRIKKGVPDSMRSRVWSLLCQAEQMKKQYPTPMSELLKKPKHQGYVTIDKDLSRTFPQIGFFSKPGFLESLRRILYCYCQTDPVLGYTQGMSFIAGMFLSYMDEETAFYSFLNVMLGKRLNQRGYFLSGFPRLDKANLMLGCLMEKRCPKILKKMDSLGVIMSMFTPGWFLTVYQSYTWQPEFQLRLFERYLFYGTRGLLNFGIVIILYHQKILEKAEMEEFLRILQHPDSSEKMLNWHSVLQDWDKNWLNKAEYEKLLTRCGVQKETDNY